MDLGDPIPLPKVKFDALGMAYVVGEPADPEPRRLTAPRDGDGPDVPDPFWRALMKPVLVELPIAK